MSEDSAIKSKAIELIMKNPELSKLVQDAWNAPIGSTQRAKAKSVLSLFGRIQPRSSSAPTPAPQKYNKTDILSLIPNHTPTLHYAKPAPKRKVAQDGQGGPGYGVQQPSPLYVNQVLPWLNQSKQDGQGGFPGILPAIGNVVNAGFNSLGTAAKNAYTDLSGYATKSLLPAASYLGNAVTNYAKNSLGSTLFGTDLSKPITNPFLPSGSQQTAPQTQEIDPTFARTLNPPSGPTVELDKALASPGLTPYQEPQKPTAPQGPVYGPTIPSQASGSSSSSYSEIQYPEGSEMDTSSSGSQPIGSQWDLNAIPGLNIYDPSNQGLSQTQYQMKVLNTISGMEDAEWQKVFPGVQKPLGSTATQHTQALIDLKKKQMGLDQMLTGYNQMAIENPKFKTDARDYIVAQDEFLKGIDGLLDDTNKKMASMPMDAPVFGQMMTSYKNYLTSMKGKTVSRYASYLNNAIDQRNTQMAQMKSDIDLKTQELNVAVAQGQEDWTSLVSMIGENYQKPALYSQNEAENLKNQLELFKTQAEILKYTTETSGTNLGDEDWKVVNQLQKTVDTGTGWNPGFDDITSLIKQYAPSNPKAVYYLMQATMASSLQAPYDENKPVDKLALAERYANSISKRSTDLKAAATELEKANPADPRLGDINQELSFLETMKTPLTESVKSVFGDSVASNWEAISSALKKVVSSRSTFSDQDKQKFMDIAKKNGVTDTKLLSYSWEALKRNAEAVRATPINQMTAQWLGSMIGNSFMYSF